MPTVPPCPSHRVPPLFFRTAALGVFVALGGLAIFGCDDRLSSKLHPHDAEPRDAEVVGDAEPDLPPRADLAPRDAETRADGLSGDARVPDAARPDAAQPDAARPDALSPDAALPDAALPDAALPDAALPDAARPDAARPDAALPDAALPDALALDAALPDSAVVDAWVFNPGPEADAFIFDPLTCSTCHGDPDSPAPPRDLRGSFDTASPGVGAHRSHLNSGSDFRAVRCDDCHIVPEDVAAPTHLDRRPADLVWGDVPSADGVSPDYSDGTCSVFCHGASLGGGTVPRPSWTTVNGTQAECGACHGLPPPAPHVQAEDCSSCHPQVMNPDGSIRNGALHVNGIVEVEVHGCTACHGDDTSPAPPRDLRGRLDTASPGVGAHRSHLNTSSDFRPVQCEDCHVVPAEIGAPGHLDVLPAELTWGELATADGVRPDYSAGTCSVYCHGATLGGGTVPRPSWTTVDDSQAECGACHGLPPPAPHVQAEDCASCHGRVMNADGSFRDGTLHVNGIVEVEVVGCVGCHALPPDTGSHRMHSALAAPEYGGLGLAADLPGGDGYAFGCGFCHPRDEARHRNGRVEVELFDPTAPPGSLKARNPATASYTPGPAVLRDETGLRYTLGTCNDVACHAGTETTSGPVARPEIDFPYVGFPIVYPPYEVQRGPAYATTPAWGSPSPGCGACHGYPPRTTYPATDGGAGESHAYINEFGDEDLHLFNHGSEPVHCATCHNATVTEPSPWARNEHDVITLEDITIADPRRHVNGVVDVVFDRVTPQPYRRPLTLEAATWDPARRSCQDVACHLEQTEVGFGAPYRFENWVECDNCHQYGSF